MNILIRTTQNVELIYPLAGTFARIAAFSIDLIFTVCLYMIFSVVFRNFDTMLFLMAAVLFFIYHLTFEIFMNGQTPGKKILKLQVISLDGNPANLEQIMIRWSFRLLDLGVTCGSLGILSMISSDLRQKVGDAMAGTIVINNSKRVSNDLLTLTKLNEIKKDHINLALKQYSDEDMIVVKNLLARNKTSNTLENRALIRKMANTFKEELGDHHTKEENAAYLSRILNEYIIITR